MTILQAWTVISILIVVFAIVVAAGDGKADE